MKCLNNLAYAMQTRFTYFKLIDDDDRSIELMRKALNVAVQLGNPVADLAFRRNNLAAVLWSKVRRD